MASLDSFSKATDAFLKELKALESSIGQMERQRKDLVVRARDAVEVDGNVDGEDEIQLRFLVEQRHKVGDRLSQLAAALDNSQATFDRLEAKADKDEKLLADVEALQKRRGRGPFFGPKHPLVRKHRNAVADLAQKLEFLDGSIQKFGDMVNLKASFSFSYAPEELVELNDEIGRMRRDYEEWSGSKSKAGEMARSVDYMGYSLDQFFR